MNRPFPYLVFALLICLFLPRSSRADGTPAGPGSNNPTGVTGEYNGSVTTAGSYDPFTGNAKRRVRDLTVIGSVGAYPLEFTRILNTHPVLVPSETVVDGNITINGHYVFRSLEVAEAGGAGVTSHHQTLLSLTLMVGKEIFACSETARTNSRTDGNLWGTGSNT